MRNVPLAEAQIALEKTKKNFLWNVGICPITEIMWKTASSHKISLKSGNLLLIYGQKRFQYGGRPLSWILWVQ